MEPARCGTASGMPSRGRAPSRVRLGQPSGPARGGWEGGGEAGRTGAPGARPGLAGRRRCSVGRGNGPASRADRLLPSASAMLRLVDAMMAADADARRGQFARFMAPPPSPCLLGWIITSVRRRAAVASSPQAATLSSGQKRKLRPSVVLSGAATSATSTTFLRCVSRRNTWDVLLSSAAAGPSPWHWAHRLDGAISRLTRLLSSPGDFCAPRALLLMERLRWAWPANYMGVLEARGAAGLTPPSEPGLMSRARQWAPFTRPLGHASSRLSLTGST